jgi:hypothetical protein
MFYKNLLIFSDSNIVITVYDNDKNIVFFDELNDIGVDEIKLISSIRKAMGFILGIPPQSISIEKGQIEKRKSELSISKNLEIILPEANEFTVGEIQIRIKNRKRLNDQVSIRDIVSIQNEHCQWQANLKCPVPSNLDFDSTHIDIDQDGSVEIRCFKSGNFCGSAKECAENLDVKNAFADVLHLLTGRDTSQSNTAHKYYNDGGGHSTIFYSGKLSVEESGGVTQCDDSSVSEESEELLYMYKIFQAFCLRGEFDDEMLQAYLTVLEAYSITNPSVLMRDYLALTKQTAKKTLECEDVDFLDVIIPEESIIENIEDAYRLLWYKAGAIGESSIMASVRLSMIEIMGEERQKDLIVQWQ